ncbi:MAG TPA: GGDEF domain-containing protein [Porticoccaceae bacterium]|jgi:diguanylate cyclase (GGDEF)-like protein|nr:GGDEF domain-containing protein [Porticoccaceae bacterium]
MKAPATSIDEAVRLTTLRSLDILDSLGEERFDRLTRMAKQMFRVPIALVSLVDENRQWFKSCVGLDVSETSRDISFCGHAILGDEVFVISDTLKDDRFSDNPLVLEDPHIRFYAGCPIRVANGSRIGTLCIIDREPRDFCAEDEELLKDLAAMVEQELTAVQLATLDEMTNLTNRRGFMGVANKILSLCVRNQIPATLAFIDLNNFKSINDQHGHAEGDRALVDFSQQLATAFRSSDVVARLGGDEFVVLFTGTSRQHAEKTMIKFSSVLEEANKKPEGKYRLSFSYGLVDYNHHAYPAIEDFLEQADLLMYENKVSRRSMST